MRRSLPVADTATMRKHDVFADSCHAWIVFMRHMQASKHAPRVSSPTVWISSTCISEGGAS